MTELSVSERIEVVDGCSLTERNLSTTACCRKVVVKFFIAKVLHSRDSTWCLELGMLDSHCCKVCYLFQFFKYSFTYGINNYQKG